MSEESGYAGDDPALYYEWRDPGTGAVPLLLLHGGGSTIASNWGALLPEMSASRPVLAVELQGHGHTAAGEGPASFERSADAVARVLAERSLAAVDLLGFSNGGQVAMQLAIRHPAAVRRLIAASAPFRRDGMVDGFWDGLAAGTFADLPAPYLAADLAAGGDRAHAERMFDLDRELMLHGFVDWPDDLVRTIAAPTLVIVADRDVVTVPHAVRLASLIPDARLLVVPGSHGDYLGEVFAANGDLRPMQRALPFLEDFLEEGRRPTTSAA